MPTLVSILPRVLPMLAVQSGPFDDPACVFDLKRDGIRALASVVDGIWSMCGRNVAQYADRYPELDGLRRLPSGTMLDGELVALRGGRDDFHALMSRHSRRPKRFPFFAEPVKYVAFDVLYWEGVSVMKRPLVERRKILHDLPAMPHVSVCESVIGEGRRFFETAIAAGQEGVIGKKAKSAYRPNQRTPAWRKVKQWQQMPCVVIGYKAGPDGLRALVVASLLDGKLRYVGVVELGIHQAGEVLARLGTIHRRRPVVVCSLSAQWVEPRLFCRVRYAGWRPGGVWRDAVFAEWDDEG